MYAQYYNAISRIILPMMACMALTAPDLVDTAYGHKWLAYRGVASDSCARRWACRVERCHQLTVYRKRLSRLEGEDVICVTDPQSDVAIETLKKSGFRSFPAV